MDHFIMTAQIDELTYEIEEFEAIREVTREEELRSYELGEYSDIHKDFHGFRPRGTWMLKASASELRAESLDLLRAIQMEREYIEQEYRERLVEARAKREARRACAKRLTTHKEFSLGELVAF